jgi:hypothetical protein
VCDEHAKIIDPSEDIVASYCLRHVPVVSPAVVPPTVAV